MKNWIAALCLIGCGGADTTTDDTDTVEEAPCTVLASGDWAFKGECPQMRTPLVMTVTDCSFTLDYTGTGMTMGMPYAGTIDGTTVTFEDGDTVTGCTGTAEAADEITGTCDGGCTFSLVQ